MSFFWRRSSSAGRKPTSRRPFWGFLQLGGLHGGRVSGPLRRRLRFEPLESRLALDASISGTVYEDLNGNGSDDGQDVGLSGVNVFIDENNNGAFDGTDIITTTDANGNYTFAGLAAGNYSVVEQVPTGWEATPQGSPVISHSVTVSANQDLLNQNFGLRSLLRRPPASRWHPRLIREVPTATASPISTTQRPAPNCSLSFPA